MGEGKNRSRPVTARAGSGRSATSRTHFLGRLARQAAPLPGADARAGAPRYERDRSLLDHAELLADHTALGVGMLHHDGALDHGADTHWLACNARLAPCLNLVGE